MQSFFIPAAEEGKLIGCGFLVTFAALRWPPKKNLIINREVSGGYCKTAVSRWPFSQSKIQMTAEQKAKELVAKFENDSWHDATGFKGGSAERCALISANEVWKQLWSLYDNPNVSDSAEIIIKEQIDFWADVKSELSDACG